MNTGEEGKTRMAHIATVGLWHLGCVVSAGLASLGHTVYATDPDAERVRNLQQGRFPLQEPGLAEFTAEQVQAGRLAFVSSPQAALFAASFIFLTFDTPVDEYDRCDLTPLENILKQVTLFAPQDATVVVMSQVPAGTCARFETRLHELAHRDTLRVAYQPENLRLGEALATFLQPDFLLVGANNAKTANDVLQLYEGIKTKKLVMGTNSAEMSKHVLNAFLATSVSFANEMADLAESGGADIRDVLSAIRLDRRIGPHAFLSPGPGFSGGTLGRDVQTLRSIGAREHRRTAQLDATLAVNDHRLAGLIEKLERECGSLSGLTIALLGLTYKPGTSTLRRSRAVEFAHRLIDAGCSVRACDPMISTPAAETKNIEICADAYQAAAGADFAVLMTPWPEFRKLDLQRLAACMRRARLMDCHNFLSSSAARPAGFQYLGVGVPQAAGARPNISVGENS